MSTLWITDSSSTLALNLTEGYMAAAWNSISNWSTIGQLALHIYGAVHLDTATFVRVPNRPEAEPKFFDHFRTCLYPQNVVQNTKGSIFCSLKTLGKGFRSTRTFKMHLKRASRDMNPNLDAIQFYILASFYPIKKLSCHFLFLMKGSRLPRRVVIRLTPASAPPHVQK